MDKDVQQKKMNRFDLIRAIIDSGNEEGILNTTDFTTDELFVIWKSIEADRNLSGGLLPQYPVKFVKLSEKTIFIK